MDGKDGDLHRRKAGRTWEQWRGEQPFRKSFDSNNSCDIRKEMEGTRSKMLPAFTRSSKLRARTMPTHMAPTSARNAQQAPWRSTSGCIVYSSQAQSSRYKSNTSSGSESTQAASAGPMSLFVGLKRQMARSFTRLM